MSKNSNKYGRNLQTYLQASGPENTTFGSSHRRERTRTRSGSSSSDSSSSATPTPSPSPSLPQAPLPPPSPFYHHHPQQPQPPHLPLPHHHHPHHPHQPQLSGSSWSLSSGEGEQRTSPDHIQPETHQNLSHQDSPALETSSSPDEASLTLNRPDADLLIRPAWVDAEVGLESLETGEATGNRSALWLRALLQARFAELGATIHRKAGLVLFLGLVLLITATVGLKSARLETSLERLWVEDGGRLTREMQYVRSSIGEGAGSTNEILIQTPKEGGGSVLYPDAMLLHWEALRFALEASVDLFEANWKLRDICFRPSTPTFESHSIDSFLERLIPCAIITPLDCFWEGSYLLGPEVPVAIPFLAMPVEWTTLNPEQLIGSMMANLKAYRRSELGTPSGGRSSTWEIEAFYKFMRSSGITTGYQMKPCLNPANPNCPPTAPNYNGNLSSLTSTGSGSNGPDIGATLTGGCFGFATKYMHWPEDLLVGGVTRNKTGHIVSAKALQSIVQLMGETALFERYQSDYKVHNTDWSVEKAKQVLEAWQRAFQKSLKAFLANAAAEDEDEEGEDLRSTSSRAGARTQNLELFTSASVNDLMRSASQLDVRQLALACLVMAVFVGVSLHRSEVEESQTFVGVVGVFLLEGALVSGFGLCAMLGLAFNAVTNLVLPLLCLGMGLDNVFLLARLYSSEYMVKCVPLESRTAETMKQASTSLLITIFTTSGCLLAAAIIPMPGLRTACLQGAILHGCLSFVVLFLFPALCSLVLRFRVRYLQQNQSETSNSPFFYGNYGGGNGHQLLQQQKQVARSPPTTLVNLFFLFCCCGRTPKRFTKGFSANQETETQNVGPISSVSCGQYSSTPYHLQAYNYYYVNSIQQRPDLLTSETPKSKKMSKSSSLDSGIDQMELSPSTSAICCCGGQSSNRGSTSSSIHTLGKEEDEERLMKKNTSCSKCGGDLRPQCEGQDELVFGEDGEQEIKKTTQEEEHLVVKMPETKVEASKKSPKRPFKFTVAYFTATFYVPFLSKKPVKAAVLLSFAALLVISVLGALKLEDGLDLRDIVPRGSTEHRFLDAQRKHFSFFYMYAVTMGNFDYPNNQRLLQEYHDAFTRIPAIVKNDDGGLPPFWLSLFRDWLLGLQAAFDRDWAAGAIDAEGWRKENASEDGILAFKLLVQTGRIDNPIDKGLLTTNRLVEQDTGIINPKAFYNYLTAWVHTDVMAYSASEGNFHPDPASNRRFSHDSHDTELKIPKAAPLTYAQMPFQLKELRTTAQITSTIEAVRAICRKYEVDRSLPNFPTGTPFTYWEQYIWLRFYIALGLAVALAVVYFTFTLLLLNPWSAALVVAILGATVLEVVGAMGWLAVKLSAVPGVILILSVGLGVSALTHVLISFITAIGDRNRRMALSIEHMFTPVKNSVVSTLIAVALLSLCQFDFIFEYFFLVLSAVLLFGALNALVLLPVVLSICGPSADVQPLDYGGLRIGTPEPLYGCRNNGQTQVCQSNDQADYANGSCGGYGPGFSGGSVGGPQITRSSKPKRTAPIFPRGLRSGRSGKGPVRVQSEISLSTISEEPNSYASSTMHVPISRDGLNQNHLPTGGQINSTNNCGNSHQQQQHEIVVQPEFVFEATAHFTNNSGQVVSSGANAAGSVTPTPESGTSSPSSASSSSSDHSSISQSPSPTSLDRDSPSGRSESAASNAGNSSRPSSAASFTTTTTTTSNNPGQANSEANSTTVTTKVMATAKLTIPMVTAHGHPALQGGSPFGQLMHHPLQPMYQPFVAGMQPQPQQPIIYPHTHLTAEPCRSCLGCMFPPGMMQPVGLSPVPHPQMQQQHPQMHQPQGRQAPGPTGAWNHGMLGPFGPNTGGLHGRRNPAGWR